MKQIIIFDLDNTLNSTKQNKVLPQTKKLIKELASKPNTVLGLATGRPPSKVYLDADFLKYFTYRIYINGAIVYKNDNLIYENPIEPLKVKRIMEKCSNIKGVIGFVGLNKEYVSNYDVAVDLSVKKITEVLPLIYNDLYKDEKIYQLWVFTNYKEELIPKLTKTTKLRQYTWHSGGFDLVDPKTNKANAIKEILKNETNYQLITVGDGHNDIDMIEMADIGIAMGNSGFNELKEKADLVAPNIEDDQLYDFFKKIKLLS